jgi:hypothetical protein
MMFKPLTDAHGEAVLMSFLAASPAPTFPALERGQASTEKPAPCGGTWQGSLAKFDPVSSSWRTHQCLLFEDSTECLETFPRWGMMRDGELWEQSTPVLRTDETESGLWPTPQANEDAAGTPDGKMQWMLTQAAKSGCTTRKQYEQMKAGNAEPADKTFSMDALTISESGNAKTAESGLIHSTTKSKTGVSIADHQKFAAPQARDYRTGSTDRWENPERSRNLNDQIGGQLNPNWVEWLMGWPLGWTDCDASATDRFQAWQHSHGDY